MRSEELGFKQRIKALENELHSRGAELEPSRLAYKEVQHAKQTAKQVRPVCVCVCVCGFFGF